MDKADVDKLMRSLEDGICLVNYTSLLSGDLKERELTTCPMYIPDGKGLTFKQSANQMDKCLAYDVEFQRWDDIDVETINSWHTIEGE
jgi:hypothetical protein